MFIHEMIIKQVVINQVNYGTKIDTIYYYFSAIGILSKYFRKKHWI